MARKPVKPDPGEPALVVDWKNRRYTIRESDVTGRMVREFRETTGLTWRSITSGRVEFDIDVAAAVVWFAQRVNGTPTDYDDLLDSVSAANIDKVGLKRTLAGPGDEGDPDDPNP